MDLKELEKYQLKITNPNKLLWKEPEITKIQYINELIKMSDYILKYTKNRMLTVIRYPHGVEGDSFFQKNAPEYTPQWVHVYTWHDKNYIILNDLPTLIWLGNQAAIELHTSFNDINKMDNPVYIVFDLDPSEGQGFEDVIEVALLVKEVLDSLNIISYIKTSGASGLQIFIPTGSQYTYDEARKVNEFFGKYLSEKHSKLITIERSVSKRGRKLYFDYLQMWHGKTIITPYSPRATIHATVSMPVSWEEVQQGIAVEQFNLMNCNDRLNEVGDLFEDIEDRVQNLDFILEFIKK